MLRGGDLFDLVDELHSLADPHHNIAVVGHEPGLSSLISLLTTGDANTLSLWLKMSGLCKLSTAELHAGRCAAFEWLLTSKQLRMLGSPA